MWLLDKLNTLETDIVSPEITYIQGPRNIFDVKNKSTLQKKLQKI